MHRHLVVSSGGEFEAATKVVPSSYRTILTYKDEKMCSAQLYVCLVSTTLCMKICVFTKMCIE
jgi:hypothetical protein